jgi:hypothetical protein
MLRLTAVAVLMASGLALAGTGDSISKPGNTGSDEATMSPLRILLEAVPGTRVHWTVDQRIDRIYGKILVTGGSARDSADRFADQYSGIWGVESGDLEAGGVLPSGIVEQPVMYDAASGTYKFTAVYFNQQSGDFPVFASRLCVLTRNISDHGAVMATADLRNLGAFQAQQPAATLTSDERMTQLAKTFLLDDSAVIESSPRTVVFAGYDNEPHTPVMAVEFVAVAGGISNTDTYQKRRFVVDAQSGAVLYDEDMILSCTPTQTRLGALVAASLGEVTGQVSAKTTASTRADACDPEFLSSLPYAAVTANGTTVYADASGNFVHPHSGGNTSFGGTLGGQWFSMNNQAGSTTSASTTGSSGDYVSITYNPSPSELVTAQANAYKEANLIRDMVLVSNPSYPTITNQTGWPINVNLGDTCNAYYDYSSINFYQAGGGCNNTAFSVVVHHEYGHHLVAEAGSGQGEYGEGMGDVMGVILTGDSKLARGFYASDCENGIRNADNTCQHSTSCSTCGSGIHACGQLISGCVWDVWGNLIISSPLQAEQIIRDLAVNSMLLHSGTSINDSIVIDYIMLDDDDGNIDNGSPHYADIAAGFGAHGLNSPALALLSITAPDGLPDYVSPQGTSTVRINVSNLSGQFDEGSARIFVGQNGSFDQFELEPDGGDLLAHFPATPCGDGLQYYFAAGTTNGQTVYWPGDAPSMVHSVIAANGPPLVIYDEDFQTNGGFAAGGSAADGAWTHGTPVNCGRGDPPTDYDGNNACWLTDNSSANGCNSDVDDGTVYITSPAMDASEPGLQLCYARWFSNDYGAAPYTDTLVVQVSDDDGATWMTLETVGPVGDEVSGGWYDVCHTLSAVSGFEPTTAMRLRVTTSDGSSNGSVVEAALDAVSLSKADCEEDPCLGDFNGDGVINVDDVLTAIAAFGNGDGGDVDGDGDTDVDDLLALMAGWGPCP